jgi:hypothetical protein
VNPEPWFAFGFVMLAVAFGILGAFLLFESRLSRAICPYCELKRRRIDGDLFCDHCRRWEIEP